MKKYLCMLAVVGLASSAFAQGTFTFASGSSLVKAGATPDTAVAIAKNGGMVQLFWAPAGTAVSAWQPSQTIAQWLAANPGWAQTDPKMINGPVAGRFSAGTLQVPTTPAGANIDAVVAAWTGNAASFDAAVGTAGSQVGWSGKFSVDTADPGNPLDLPGTTIGAFQGITALPVGPVIPEPSTLTLAGLGAAAMLIFRRRK